MLQFVLKYKLVIVAAVAAFGAWYVCDAISDAEIAELKTQYANEKQLISEKHQEELAKARTRERAMQDEIALIDKRYSEEISNARQETQTLRDRIRNGDIRLSVSTRNESCRSVSGSTDSTGLDNGTGRTEIDPKHAERIIRITDYGDEQIRKLNACQAVVKSFIQLYSKPNKKN